MEAAGHNPILTDARKAKARMGQTNKTDKLDAEGLVDSRPDFLPVRPLLDRVDGCPLK